jgi:hypothetical protein
MSTSPAVPLSPFVPETTPTIERANRLISVRSNPGFLDILRISQELVDRAAAVLVDYGGWDPQQIMVLKARAQAAKEHHNTLLGSINDAIREGVEEGRTVAPSAKTATDALDQGDHVRRIVLEKFEEFDSRPAGSYNDEG